jgi:hypothetical protein
MSRTKKTRSKVTTYVYLLLSLVLLLTLTNSYWYNQANQQDDNIKNKAEYQQLIEKNSSLAPGYACGILPTNKVTELLGSEVERSVEHGVQEVVPTVLSIVDTCRYEAKNSSANYVELHITSYSNHETAMHEFTAKLPLVGKSKKLDNEPYGDKLIYDSGVYYLLRGKHVIEVAASNGTPSLAEVFSRQVFEEVVNLLEL